MQPMRQLKVACSVWILITTLIPVAGCDIFTSTKVRTERARQELAQGNFSAAAIDLRNVLKKKPEDTEARLMLVSLLLKTGDVQTAEVELDRTVQNGVDAAQVAPLRADILLLSGRALELLKHLENGSLALAEPARSVMRGRALNSLRRPEDASAEFEHALQVDSSNAAAQIGLAESLAARARSDEALGVLSKVPDGAPEASEARVLQGRIFLSRGQYADAEAAFLTARELSRPDSALFQKTMLAINLAESQLALGKIDAAAATQQQLARDAPRLAASQLLQSRIELARGNYDAAVADLQRLVAAAPDYVQARMMLGVAHLGQGNLFQAESQLAQVVNSAPDNVEARKLLARVRLQLDRPDAALQVLTPALGEGVDDAQFYSLLGVAQLRAGNTDKALAALEQNVRLHPNDEGLRADLASGYVSIHRYLDAIDVLRAAPAKLSSRAATLLVAATAAEGGQPKARAEVERLLKEQPDDPQILYVAAAYFGSQREFERARGYLGRILTTDPADVRALVGLANIEFAIGNLAAAEQNLRKALLAQPSNPELHLAMAQLQLARGDVTQARASIEAAVKSGQGHANIENAAGRLLSENQRYDEALAHLRRATDLDSNKEGYWLDTARVQLALNQPTAARESIEKALKIRPDWIQASSLLVLIDLRASGSAAALVRAKELRARHPDEPAVLVLEGDVQAISKNYREAVAAYEQAEHLRPEAVTAVKTFEAMKQAGLDRPEAPLLRWLGLRPEDGRVRMVLGQYYIQTNRAQRAVAEFETVSRQEPNNAVVLNNLAWLYHTQGNVRAEETARRAHELAPNNAAISDTYGWILLGKQRTDLALPLLEAAARSAADNAEIQYHYGAALAAAGRHDEAKTVLNRALNSKQNFSQRSDAEKLLSRLES